jgi:ABC-type Mn2+/Zn2+ transport system ATPase subunit
LTEKKAKSFCVKKLSIRYDYFTIISNLSFLIHSGEMVVLMGPNGSGKTTLLNTLAGLHLLYQGSFGMVDACDKEYKQQKHRCLAYLPQRNGLDRFFPMSVLQIVRMGIWPSLGLLQRFSREDHEKVDHALEKVRLSAYRNRPISCLSGGQFQRMLFARMMVQDSEILLLDEPFSGIDEETINELMVFLMQWSEQGKMILLSQHSRGQVLRFFTHALLLGKNLHYWGSPKDVLTDENFSHAYQSVNAPFPCSNKNDL